MRFKYMIKDPDSNTQLQHHDVQDLEQQREVSAEAY